MYLGYVSIYMSSYMSVFVHICVYVCIYACRVYLCMSIVVCTGVNLPTCTCSFVSVCTWSVCLSGDLFAGLRLCVLKRESMSVILCVSECLCVCLPGSVRVSACVGSVSISVSIFFIGIPQGVVRHLH